MIECKRIKLKEEFAYDEGEAPEKIRGVGWGIKLTSGLIADKGDREELYHWVGAACGVRHAFCDEGSLILVFRMRLETEEPEFRAASKYMCLEIQESDWMVFDEEGKMARCSSHKFEDMYEIL